MKRASLKLILLCLAVLLSSGALAAGGGNGSLYGGGDPAAARLAPARARLSRALELLGAGFNVTRVCAGTACGDAGNPQCRVLAALTTAQRESCRTWIISRAAELAAWNTDERTPLQISPAPVLLPPSAGGRAVAAMTRLGTEGAIVFDRDRLQGIDEAELIALLGHEISHKPRLPSGAPVADDVAYGPFPRGADFLDAVGAALSVYTLRQAIPAQAAPPVPDSIAREQACLLAGNPRQRYLLGLHADTIGKLPDPEAVRRAPVDTASLDALAEAQSARVFVRSLVGSTAAREQTLRRLFQRYLLRGPSDEELALMIARVSAGVPYEAVVASILGDDEYTSLRGAQAPAAWLGAVFSDLTGTAPSPTERPRFLAALQHRERASVSIAILRETSAPWEQWIREWHVRWLNRDPTAIELAQLTGELRRGAGWEAVMASLLWSAEYVALQALRWESCEAEGASVARANRTGKPGAVVTGVGVR